MDIWIVKYFGGYMELSILLSILLDIWNYTIQVVLLKGILAVILLMEEIPVKTHLGYIKPCFLMGEKYQTQLVRAGFLNHQQ